MTTSGITVFGQPSQPNHGAGGRIAMDDAVFPTDYVALDLETTGFYPNSCAITEIGARARAGGAYRRSIPAAGESLAADSASDHHADRHHPMRWWPISIRLTRCFPDSSHGSLPRLPVPPSSRLSAITSASICDSWITTPGISPAAALPARIMTRCRSAAPCSPRSGITVWPT